MSKETISVPESRDTFTQCAATYPFEPGVTGVDFAEILGKFHEYRDKISLTVTGGSGAHLKCSIDTTGISLVDAANPVYELKAQTDRNHTLFSLYTQPLDKKNNHLPRHPDLYAGKFIDFSLAFFNQTGHDIHSVQGIWSKISDDYFIYNQAKLQGLSDNEAVQKTWTGLAFLTRGFHLPEYGKIERHPAPGGVSFWVVFTK